MTRTLLVLLIAAIFALCVAGMLWGYRNRARRQAAVLPPFPEPPADLGAERLTTTGVYASTTTDASWQDRIAIGDIGHRSAATLRLHDAGLLVERDGASPVWIPAESLVQSRTSAGHAGKVMGGDGVLVIRWRLGEQLLDTGFRGDDKDVYPEWSDAITELVGAQGKAVS
ncbi:hypothetical protein EV193_102169 [Herbihabitans rhizosphaerae]|uniref:PH domain-containing protein n=1 Tax=Herbihabitans rhizosphaerae TaxID=1872711 RepID=A0A4Q7L387_9PSEU|nr:transporter [Herbihabitans rhizosphaerae]RZS43190.1 hypothetical protein EV193_102169 [Herbihabitans rhizosphaerae]